MFYSGFQLERPISGNFLFSVTGSLSSQNQNFHFTPPQIFGLCRHQEKQSIWSPGQPCIPFLPIQGTSPFFGTVAAAPQLISGTDTDWASYNSRRPYSMVHRVAKYKFNIAQWRLHNRFQPDVVKPIGVIHASACFAKVKLDIRQKNHRKTHV